MSLSKPRSSANPVSRYFRIKASTGEISHWSKADNKEVLVDLPFRFIVADSFGAISGFHEASNSSIFSNEVRSTREEPFVVRSKSGVLAEGLYESIRDRLRGLGGRFTTSAYVAYKDDGEWQLGNIKFAGASLSAWLDFSKGRHLDVQPGVVITGFEAAKKGATKYHVPQFDGWDVGAADLAAASSLDETLQQFLGAVPAKAEESAGVEPDGFDPEPPF